MVSPCTKAFKTSGNFYRPQGKLIFSEASVHEGGYVVTSCPSSFQGDLFWRVGGGLLLTGQFLGGSGHPRVLTSNGGHCSGREACYWNAFLFAVTFTQCAYPSHAQTHPFTAIHTRYIFYFDISCSSKLLSQYFCDPHFTRCLCWNLCRVVSTANSQHWSIQNGGYSNLKNKFMWN